MPRALAAYPLIITRRDPASSRPPSAYALAWQNSYYQVWKRRPRARVARVHLMLAGSPVKQCALIARVAARAGGAHDELVAAQPPLLIDVALRHASHPKWGHERRGRPGARPGQVVASAGDTRERVRRQ
jgi:hypothetical protein